jgi:hypothetical protein
MPIIAGRASAAYGAGFGAITEVPFAGPFGAYDFLSSVTVPSGGLASIEFAGIPTGYKHLQIRAIARHSAASTETAIIFRFNGDATAGNYYGRHMLNGDGTNLIAVVSTGGSFTGATVGVTTGANNTANVFGVNIVDILDYTNTQKNKTLRCLQGFDQNGSGGISFVSSLWMNTAAVTSITAVAFNGASFVEHSSFALYGVK